MIEDAKARGAVAARTVGKVAADGELNRDGRYGTHALLWTLVALLLMGIAALWWPARP